MNDFDYGSWLAIGPQIALGLTVFAVLLLYALRASVSLQAGVAVIGIIASAVVNTIAAGAHENLSFPASLAGLSTILVNASVTLDKFAIFLFYIFLFVALSTCLVSGPYLEKYKSRIGEFYVTVLLATLGMMIMVTAQDMLVLYLGLETMSLSAYVLSGFFIDRMRSQEAALKYLLTGALGSALLLYGVAFLYGATGTIAFRGIGETIGQASQQSFVLLGTGLLLSGFAFKIAAVPFHMWTPDVYQGAPTPVSGLMAVGVKAAAFAALTRIVMISLANVEETWLTWLLYFLAVFTMIWGNIAAIAQKNIKRLLAYSSIAHAGYLMIAVTVHNEVTRPAILLYLASYALMTLGAFSVVMLLEKRGERHLEIENYAGLVNRHPYLAVCMTVFLVSLAGIPPTFGFIGKWYVFSSAIQRGFITLAIIGVSTSLVSIYYYMRVAYVMFMKDAPEDETQVATMDRSNYAAQVVAFGFAIMVILIGCFPSTLISFARNALWM